MKIKRICYRRKFNLGNYENEDIEFIADVDEDEDPEQAFKKLRKLVDDMARGV